MEPSASTRLPILFSSCHKLLINSMHRKIIHLLSRYSVFSGSMQTPDIYNWQWKRLQYKLDKKERFRNCTINIENVGPNLQKYPFYLRSFDKPKFREISLSCDVILSFVTSFSIELIEDTEALLQWSASSSLRIYSPVYYVSQFMQPHMKKKRTKGNYLLLVCKTFSEYWKLNFFFVGQTTLLVQKS